MSNFERITASPDVLGEFLASLPKTHCFGRMLKERERKGKMQGSWNMGTTGEDVFHWWMEDGVLPGQLDIEDLLGETEGEE